MNIILLSGGSGTRLWPLSNEVRSKQFLKVFKKEDGTHESMIQRMYRMLKEVAPDASLTVATSESQIPQIKYELGENVGISIEPCRRDTFPAIALACAYIHKNGVGLDEPVVVCPVDPYVNKDYFEKLKELSDEAGKANLTLMGITPTYPSTKYGYILPSGKFTEKPDEKKAEELISLGACWNGGVFAFKLGYLLKKTEEILGSSDYDTLFNNYENLKKISFDYAVAEHEDSIKVLPFNGQWKDLGTWNTLTEVMSEPVSGDATLVDCENTHVINELGMPLITIGIDNAIVAATPDGILVSDKNKSAVLKDYVKKARPMHEARPWGHYSVLDVSPSSLTKHLIIAPNKHISYQIHNHRTEMWTFVEGEGELIIDDEIRKVGMGDSVVIPVGTKHAIKAVGSELHIIEVQVGDHLVEEDIIRLDWDWKE